MIPRKAATRITTVFFFMFSVFAFGTFTNWYYMKKLQREIYIRIPGVVLASRNSPIPINTAIHVDSTKELLLDTITLVQDSEGLVYNSSMDPLVHDRRNNIYSDDTEPSRVRPEVKSKRSKQSDGESIKGQSININIWDEICSENLESLKNYPLFPTMPSRKLLNRNLKIPNYGNNLGLMAVGFLLPKCGGYHTFELTHGSGNAEFWISSNDKPENSILISSTASAAVKEVHLQRGKKFYFEILYKVGKVNDGLEIKVEHQDQFCTEKNLLSFQPYFPSEKFFTLEVLDINHPWSKDKKLLDENDNLVSNRKNMHRLSFFDAKDTENLLPTCKCDSEYLVNWTLGRYDGVWETQYSLIYPSDNSNITNLLSSGKKQTIFGNDLLDEKEAIEIANSVMQFIGKRHPRKYKLMTILNIEKRFISKTGARYLVELELLDMKKNRRVRFSEYVCKPEPSSRLCFPEDFKWNKNAVVNLILTAGGQGRWAKYFITAIEEIYKATKDENINLIIVDFNTKSFSLKQHLEASSIPRYILLSRHGAFYKSEAIQQASNTILNQDEIVLLMDLHLLIPNNFIDTVRKNCVQGKMAFNPILARLRCEAHQKQPLGFWENLGYGIFGTYKSDWDVFGGMNYAQFKNRWGGEDWEMLDRVLMANYELSRLKIAGFYHVFHTKKGMWNSFNS